MRVRVKNNQQVEGGRLINGYDYRVQAWVKSGKYVRCGHPENMKCFCYGRKHEGEEMPVEIPSEGAVDIGTFFFEIK